MSLQGKKIVISANTSWYLYNFRRNTILSLLEEGYRVIAISPLDSYSSKLESLGCDYLDIEIDQGGTNPIKDIKTFISFFKIYRSLKPSVVLNFTPKNNIYSTLAASMNKASSINNVAGLGMLFIRESFASKIALFLYKISQKKAKIIFFQNNDDRLIFLEKKIAPEYLTDLLPGSGVDLDRFIYSPAPDDGIVRFLLVARMLFDKGVGYYVDAARLLRLKYGSSVEFNLLGFLDVNNPSAVSKVQMEQWVHEGAVNYLGSSDKVEDEMANTDCIVLPSYYREGVPKSLLEAAAMGKPIVTTNNIGCRETVVDGFNGFLCELHSAESLLENLESIIQMPHEERLQMGRNGRSKMESEFSETIVIDKYHSAILEELTG